MSTSNKLKAFVRFDGSGRVVPSSVILARFKPKVGNYHEIDAYECCNEAPTTTTTTTQGGDVTPTAWVANISTTGGLWNACNNPNVTTVVYTLTDNVPLPPNTPIYADAACTILAYGCCFVTISISGYVYELINGYTNPLGGYGQPCAEITTTTTTTTSGEPTTTTTTTTPTPTTTTTTTIAEYYYTSRNCADTYSATLKSNILYSTGNVVFSTESGECHTIGVLTSGTFYDFLITSSATDCNTEPCPTTTTTTTAAVTYTIGQEALGGIIAYINGGGSTGTSGLVATVADISTGAEWGCFPTFITGADGTAIGTGNQNTIDIMAGCATAGIAARLCGDLTQGGYSDWYLPSKDELDALYTNRVAIGGFALYFYWSSTESDFYSAWSQSFNNGLQLDYDKSDPYYVRAIRSF